jgi:RHS repeat-associated protein
VVSDVRKPVATAGSIDTWTWQADITDYFSYYPFGMQEPGRQKQLNTVDDGGYRFGFNGMEMDDEIAGRGNSYTTFFRQYDSRIGKWWSIDPRVKEYPWSSPYVTNGNNPILRIDPRGDGDYYFKNKCIGTFGEAGDGRIIVVTSRDAKRYIESNKDAATNHLELENFIENSNDEYFELPSYEDRQRIADKVNSTDLDYTEVGGRRISNPETGESVYHNAVNGDVTTPEDTEANIDLRRIDPSDMERVSEVITDIYDVDYTWHAHPEGTWVKTDNGWITKDDYDNQNSMSTGSTSTLDYNDVHKKTFDQKPSIRDIDNAIHFRRNHNFVISTKNNRVYYYNQRTEPGSNSGKMKWDFFQTVQEGQNR